MASVVFADLVGSTGNFERHGELTADRFVTRLASIVARMFKAHNGLVVKLLGDRPCVVFMSEHHALEACIAIRRLQEQSVHAGGDADSVQVQMGIASGEIVEIDGGCHGGAVNCAVRLADLAGAGQILTTSRVRDALPAPHRERLRYLGSMHLCAEVDGTEVFRVDGYPEELEASTTILDVSIFNRQITPALQLSAGGHTLRLRPRDEKLTLGRSRAASLALNDGRVSRVHATVEWRRGHFVLTDTSSFGTWVYMGDRAEPVVLRRSEGFLMGQGLISLGCQRDSADAPLVVFAARA